MVSKNVILVWFFFLRRIQCKAQRFGGATWSSDGTSGNTLCCSWIPDPGSRIPDPESVIQNPGSRVQDPTSSILDPRSCILDSGFRIQNL